MAPKPRIRKFQDGIMQIDLSIVIVTTNAIKHIENCLRSIAAWAPPPNIEVIISDNGSTDGTIELVKSKFPDYKLILGENKGFGTGNNRGIEISNGRYILVLNDDTIIIDNSLQKIIEYMDLHPEIGLLGPKLLNEDRSLQPSITRHPTIWWEVIRLISPYKLLSNSQKMRDKLNFHSKLFSRVNLGRYGKHDKIMDVDGVKGACMFMRREALEVAGNFDEKIFLQTEESDIAFRIHAAGWRVIYYPDAEIVHLWGSTTGRADSSSSGRLIIQKYQSNLYFYRKNRGILHSWIYKYCISIPLIVRVFILTIS
ncbi:MAG: glycosyltransferase family 2 protein, partial [Candidatus Marinimicrobia bacterium]|nr:glycosyltransferase family 2 protein [Candidatus Neomarinimicrobiota bacterium]